MSAIPGADNMSAVPGADKVGGCGDAGTAVFQTAYAPHDQLSATVRADALWAAPDNAGPPAGSVPVYTQWWTPA
ncbi:hypothetical protein [Candidatus Thiosymbion oneisti]|uniref:hypothetical protein n=1 Tax=Candidatus Thiosymbion oneisti TaxID=589554 RepID=UPI00105FFF36|nr:hypothetical protein [Candidatus Thiosymbion oneisti]